MTQRTPPKLTILKVWMQTATTAEQEELARRAGTTRGMLYLVSSAHRQFSAELAGRIEEVTADMNRTSKGRLPKLYRTDLARACQVCAYAHKCLGNQALRSEFQ